MEPDRDAVAGELTDREVEAVHEVELAAEWIHRAHGKLLAVHHNTGHAMEHLAAAETLLRESGHDDVADDVRDRYLPQGVIDDDRWTYDLLECFEAGLLAEMTGLEERVRDEFVDGQRHVAERRQEREWKERAQRD